MIKLRKTDICSHMACIGIVFALLLGCASGFDRNASRGAAKIDRLTLADGQRVSVALPLDLADSPNRPLIVVLHPGGPRPPFVGEALLVVLFEPALRPLGALLAAPDCRGRDWTDPQSETDILALIDSLASRYAIDRQRVLLAGVSMGAIGTWHLLARHADFFSAGLIISGSPPGGLPADAITTPLYILHSLDDVVVPLDATRQLVRSLQTREADVTLVTVRGIEHYQIGKFRPHLDPVHPWLQQRWNSLSGTE